MLGIVKLVEISKKTVILGVIFSLFLVSSNFVYSSINEEVIRKIKDVCVDVHLKVVGNKMLRDGVWFTEKGDFIPSDIHLVNKLFSLYLKPGMKFIDLGSGDGHVVLFASLFGVEATGIEYDPVLYQISLEIKDKLDEIIDTDRVNLIKGDYFDYNLQDYDVFFATEDVGDEKFMEKFLKEAKKGSLLIVPDNYLDNKKLKEIEFFPGPYEISDDDIQIYRKM
jgi:cyclopropane fatty-acyl-phospholipid synthase-like methyltransferase